MQMHEKPGCKFNTEEGETERTRLHILFFFFLSRSPSLLESSRFPAFPRIIQFMRRAEGHAL